VVLVPGAPLITILVATQVLNAILLIPLLLFMYGLSRDQDLLGNFVVSRAMAAGYLFAIGLITSTLVALAVVTVTNYT
jgi:Mn2+/Fe2+ NRAMP family transporter